MCLCGRPDNQGSRLTLNLASGFPWSNNETIQTWTAFNGSPTISQTTDRHLDGIQSLRLSASADAGLDGGFAYGAPIPPVEISSFTFILPVWVVTADPTYVSTGVSWFDGGGGFLGFTGGEEGNGTPGEWNYYTAEMPVMVGAETWIPVISFFPFNGAHVLDVDLVQGLIPSPDNRMGGTGAIREARRKRPTRRRRK